MVCRREFLRGGMGGLVAGLAGCGGARTDGGNSQDSSPDITQDGGTSRPPTTGDGETGVAVRLDTIALLDGPPTGFAVSPSGDYRYLLEQPGRIRVHGPNGLAAEPFLDIRDRLVSGGERGLLGMAFHPDDDGRFYVRYSAPTRAGTPPDFSHTFVLAEFRSVTSTRADPESERAILEIPQPQSNHNSGSIVFGPKNLLYIGVGDGGGAADEGLGHVSGGNGQDVTENLLGSVLRINVGSSGESRAYAIPTNNPVVGESGLKEQYAWGLRNPWGMSFDRGDLFVADVGQSSWEEVNLVDRGGNYGWNIREGSACFRKRSCADTGPHGEPLRDPVIEYPNGNAEIGGIAVIGGYRYRGTALPDLDGRYVFGDLRAKGRLFKATPSGGDTWPVSLLEIVPEDRPKLGSLRAIGRDRDGELYAAATGDRGPGVYKLVPPN